MKKLLLQFILQNLTRNTVQAIGGVITASGVDIGALSHGQLTVDSFSAVATGAIIQSAAYAWSCFDDWRRARKAAAK